MENLAQAQGQARKSYARYGRAHGRAGRRTGRRGGAPRGDFRETLLTQCIICSVMLALVLVICIVNAPATQGVRVVLRQAVTKSYGTDGLWAARDVLDDVTQSVRTVFGERVDGTEPDYEAPAGQLLEADEPGARTALAPEALGQDRIDEDILSIINAKDEFYSRARENMTDVKPLGERQMETKAESLMGEADSSPPWTG